MKDRIPKYPGRVRLVPVAGQENVFDLVRADEPTQEGTPINKATLLTDEVAALFGLGDAALPNDVLRHIWEQNYTRFAYGSYVGDGNYGAANPNTLEFGFEPMVVIVAKSEQESDSISGSIYGTFPWLRGTASAPTSYSDNTGGAAAAVLTWEGNTLSWHSTSTAARQLNSAEITYYYAALGGREEG